MKRKKVSIVGAGPGAVDLITVRGLRAIQSADAILYDALVNKELLKEAQPDCELIFVGKRSGKHSFKQDEINRLLVENAFHYDHVVRLKGGDPFIFGRGHEELEYVESFNIEVEVIPGLSSSTALTALSGIPLTKRNINESFWVLTGTIENQQLSKDIAIAAQSSATLVILMGIKKLPLIRAILLENGKVDLPIAIISKGSTAQQRVIYSTVKDIVDKAQQEQVERPGIIVAGPTVALASPDYLIEKAAAVWKA